MPFTWNHYLDLAGHLSDIDKSEMKTDSEAYYRASVSRAYYSAFKLSMNWVAEKTGKKFRTPNGADSHKYLIEYMNNHIENSIQSSIVYSKLRSLKSERKEADYKDASPTNIWDKKRTETNIALAKSVVNILSTANHKI